MAKSKTPMPRIDTKRKLVCVYSTSMNCFEVWQVTNKGRVSHKFKPQIAFTKTIKDAFQKKFTVPFARFRAVPKVDKNKCNSWNNYIETIWKQGNQVAI